MQTPLKLHYGWIIIFTGAAVSFACLGLGRFALGMLLPSMDSSLGLTYSEMGLISTGNFIGYLVSVAFAGAVSTRLGARVTIAAGLVLVGVPMIVVGQSQAFFQILVMYAVTGIGSGLANVALMGLIAFWFHHRIRGRAAGFMLAGNGFAIVLAGIFVPLANTHLGREGWRSAWVIMGMIAVIVAGMAAVLLRNNPASKGLAPMGQRKPHGTSFEAEASHKESPSGFSLLMHLGALYALFGATYVVYATFMVTALVKERDYPEAAAGIFWAVVGAFSIFSGPLFGWVSDRWGRKIGMVAVFMTFTCSYAMVAAKLPEPFLYGSVMLFGLSVWSIPSIMAAAVGDYMGPAKAAKAFGLITVFFSAGQVSGPVAAGFLTDAMGTFDVAFWMCAALTACAAGLALFLKPLQKTS
jgi:MFS family permease